jgi:hypothetical protein
MHTPVSVSVSVSVSVCMNEVRLANRLRSSSPSRARRLPAAPPRSRPFQTLRQWPILNAGVAHGKKSKHPRSHSTRRSLSADRYPWLHELPPLSARPRTRTPTAKAKPVGDYVAACVALGMIAVSVTLGLHTARQQLAHAPNVRLDKRKRETVAEVADPDLALHDADRFVGGSVFRRVAQVQDDPG